MKGLERKDGHPRSVEQVAETLFAEVEAARHADPPHAFDLTNRILCLAEETDDLLLAARTLRFRGVLYGEQGQIEKASADLSAAIESARNLGARWLEAQCLHGLAMVRYHRADYPQALDLITRSVAIRRETEDGERGKEGLVAGLTTLASVQGTMGDLAGAADSLIEASRIARACGSRYQEAILLGNLALLRQECGDLDGALSTYARSIALFEGLSERLQLSNTLSNMANAYRQVARPFEARGVARRAVLLARETGNAHQIAVALLSLGAALAACGERSEAEAILLEALAQGEQAETRGQVSSILCELGQFYQQGGDLTEARLYLEKGLQRASRDNSKEDVCTAHQLLSDLCQEEGNCEAALTHFKAYHEANFALSRDTAQNRLLRESERRLREAQQTARIGSWEYDVVARSMSWSTETFRLLGLNPLHGEPDSIDLMQRLHAEDALRLQEALAQAIREATPFELDIRTVERDRGETATATNWLHIRGQGGTDGRGKVTRLHGTIQEVTERKQAEEERHQQAERDRRVAEMLQEAVLPTLPENALPGWEVRAFYQPVSDEAIVGGDFYDVFSLKANQYALVVGDVVGHGLAAALSIAEVRFTLRGFLSENAFADPADALRRLNRFLCRQRETLGEQLNRNALIALTLAVVNAETGRVRVAAAGMDPLLLIRAERHLEQVDAADLILGADADATYATRQVTLEEGDLLMLTTDGLTEARPHNGTQQFGLEGIGHALLRGLQSNREDSNPLHCLGERVLRETRAFAGGAFHDDTCMLLARRIPEAERLLLRPKDYVRPV